MLSKDILKDIISYQKNEITEYHVYKMLAKSADRINSGVLNKLADEELKHYNIWKTYTEKEVRKSRLKIIKYYILSKLFGLTFTIKLMENGEQGAQKNYKLLKEEVPESENILHDEEEHEKILVNMISEERLEYIGSMVLGLNDALVELTGTLCGLTLALQNTKMIGIAGLITGVAAALSMSASEYLSKKSEEVGRNPLKSSVYTGAAYIITVILLIVPYFMLSNYYITLASTLFIAIFIIFIFTYFISVVKETDFKTRFLEMAGLSIAVAAISFFIGYALRTFLHIDV